MKLYMRYKDEILFRSVLLLQLVCKMTSTLITQVSHYDNTLHYIMTSCFPSIPRHQQSNELMADDALAV